MGNLMDHNTSMMEGSLERYTLILLQKSGGLDCFESHLNYTYLPQLICLGQERPLKD